MTTAREALEMAEEVAWDAAGEGDSCCTNTARRMCAAILALRSSVQEEPAARAVEGIAKVIRDLKWMRETERKGIMAMANSDDTMFESCVSRLEAIRASTPASSNARAVAEKCYYPEECKIYGRCIRPDDHDNPPPCASTLPQSAQNNAEVQQEVNSGKAEAAQKQHGVNQGHTASEPPYRRTEFTAPAAASAPFARNDTPASQREEECERLRGKLAELRSKNGKRPCDCSMCDCGNSGDTYSVGSWDGADWVLNELATISQPTTQEPK